MSWQTNPFIITIRSLARHFGINRFVAQFRPNKSYEKAFDDALFAAIKSGAVVWDVGANVGHYTRKFAQVCGPNGKVIAFEPFPSTFEYLRAAIKGFDTVSLHQMALGAEIASMTMQGGTDNLAATSRIVEGYTGDSTVNVDVITGDAMIMRSLAPCPTVIKIDTEGFELDVLRGMTDLLLDTNLQGLFIEVHFDLLAKRGMLMAPKEIENLLIEAGFNTSWVDSSHIAALRG